MLAGRVPAAASTAFLHLCQDTRIGNWRLKLFFLAVKDFARVFEDSDTGRAKVYIKTLCRVTEMHRRRVFEYLDALEAVNVAVRDRTGSYIRLHLFTTAAIMRGEPQELKARLADRAAKNREEKRLRDVPVSGTSRGREGKREDVPVSGTSDVPVSGTSHSEQELNGTVASSGRPVSTPPGTARGPASGAAALAGASQTPAATEVVRVFVAGRGVQEVQRAADVPEVQEVRATAAAGPDLLAASDVGVRLFGNGTRAAGADSPATVQGAARCPRCLDNGLTAFGETCDHAELHATQELAERQDRGEL